MRLSIAYFISALALGLGGTAMSVVAGENIRIGASHHRLLQLFQEEEDEVMSADALAKCLDNIASFQGLDVEPMPSSAAQTLLLFQDPKLWSKWCSINLELIDSYGDFEVEETEPEAEQGQETQTLQSNDLPNYAAPSYPKNSEIRTLYRETAFTGNTYDRIDGLDNRCNTKDEADDLFNLLAVELIDEGAEAACGFSGFACPAAAITGVNVILWRIAVEGCALHDGLVDGAEIEATYENVKELMKEELKHFHDLDTRFDTVDVNMADFETATNARFDTVDVNMADFETAMNARFDTVDVNMADFETATNARFDTVDDNMADFETATNARFDTVDVNMADFETAMNARFDTVDAAFAALNDRLDTIENTLETRFNQVDTLLAMLRTLAITPNGQRTGWNSVSDICDGDEAATGNCALVANYP